jgi:hypothetical protein
MAGFVRMSAGFTTNSVDQHSENIELQNARQHGRGILEGLALSAGAGLELQVSAGTMIGSIVKEHGALTQELTASSTLYIWLSEDGAISTTADATDPGGTLVCLGKAVTSGVAITSLTTEGRMELSRWESARLYQIGNSVVAIDNDGPKIGFFGVTPVVRQTVADPAALTAPADMGAAYTESEVQALRDDVAALRATLLAVTNLLQAYGLSD